MTTSVCVYVAGALFSGDGKLLLLKRGDGLWELPTGALEFGEEPEYGVARAFVELTGVDVATDRPLGGWSEIENGVHKVYFGWTMTLTSALLAVEVETATHVSFAWITQKEIGEKIESPPLRKACERAFANLVRARKNK